MECKGCGSTEFYFTKNGDSECKYCGSILPYSFQEQGGWIVEENRKMSENEFKPGGIIEYKGRLPEYLTSKKFWDMSEEEFIDLCMDMKRG